MHPAPCESHSMIQQAWVLVTGGALRLGREIGLAFARAGWNVLCHYRTSEAEALTTQAAIRDIGRDCLLVHMDLAQPDATSQLLNQCVTLTGSSPRCIVNNASIFEADDACTANTRGLLDHFQTNTVTPLLLGNALYAWLQTQPLPGNGHYSVIHVLDQKVHNINPDYFSYTVSKLALAHSIALQAQALAPLVRVCGLSPGLVYLSGPQTQNNFDRASQINLLQQRIQPADVARCAVFIAQNTSLNGCTLQADNGQHLVPLSRDVMWAIEENSHQ
ncbi:MAG TPA: short-chain dehydrogenase [Comamonadaceae bacterium]|nr:short-chain dehydrogenase [Comamonadaceae bacterium]